ncbi:sensor histidine kinase [Sphingomonas aliaeris]|uniref:histidine kinase n=1 Tax=Sphingomonas aliaeris TaxID=2759526 RepID=A0A974NW74_9SPHN|nr:ATP-binding protein [Sphingomonas aliaeris]QQV77917.1 sensor histidine kinase [Sphingomonas aliaeris]
MPVDGDGVDWEHVGLDASEAPLLLADLQHRVANEVACALAAMRLARTAGQGGLRVSLFDRAIDRLEGFGKVHGVLAARPARTIDVDASLQRLCRGLVAGRDGLDDARIRLSVTTAPIPGGPAYRLLLIASELIFNGMRHALVGRSGHLDINVSQTGDEVKLIVEDDGPGIRDGAGTAGTGLGAGIVEGLVRMGNGRIECETSGTGTVFRVTLPLAGRSAIGWIVPETVA